jgi:hypothetical protein
VRNEGTVEPRKKAVVYNTLLPFFKLCRFNLLAQLCFNFCWTKPLQLNG